MTGRRRRAFDPNALDNDLDAILPSAASTSYESEPAVTPPQQEPQVLPPLPDNPAPAKPNRRSTPSADRIRAKASEATGRVSPPEVALDPAVYTALRDLTLRERRTHPARARSYGQVVLDAIDQHADQLQQHWRETTGPRVGGLFRRIDQTFPTGRRRHSTSPARVPLAGVIASDADLMDELARQWGAGSRSALVEKALRLYLGVHDQPSTTGQSVDATGS